MTTTASSFVFPGSAQRRRSSMDVSDTIHDESRQRRTIENPLLLNLRTPLASTNPNKTTPIQDNVHFSSSSPFLPFSPFSPPASLRRPPPNEVSALTDPWEKEKDTENIPFFQDATMYGLRQRKKLTTSSSPWMMQSTAPKEKFATSPPRIPTTSYSLGTSVHAPPPPNPTVRLSSSSSGIVPSTIPTSPTASRWTSDYCYYNLPDSSSYHHGPASHPSTSVDGLLLPAPFIPQEESTNAVPRMLTEEDILMNPLPPQGEYHRNHLASSSSSCCEQILRYIFAMDVS